MTGLIWVLIFACLCFRFVQSKSTSITKDDHRSEFHRLKRQFGVPPDFRNPLRNVAFGHDIVFDNDNVFNDFVRPTRTWGKLRQNTQRTPVTTSVAIPGMGTPRSGCEDRCFTTPQYDPVCGDNNVTYMNIARFNCARRCGLNVRILAYRACPRV